MALNPFDSAPRLPENPGLRRALARLRAEPTPEHRAALHAALAQGPVLVAIKELPDGIGTDPEVLEGGLPVRFVTGRSPGGAAVIAAFSGVDAVAARAPAGVWLAVPPLALLRWIADEGLEGLALDPEGAAAFVSRDAVLAILGLESRGSTRGRPLSLGDAAETAIRDALAALPAGGGALEVREPRTGKFVRFAQQGDGSLVLDLPIAALSPDELQRARVMFDELAGDVEAPAAEAGAAEPARLCALFAGDPGRAAKAALKVFTWVFGFPPRFELETAPACADAAA